MAEDRRPIRVSVRRPEDGRSTSTGSSAGPRVGASRASQSPPTDIHETAAALILEVDLPGAGEADVVVQLEDSVLSLQANARPTIPEGARRLYQEAGPREFARSFILGDDVDAGRITADLKDGVLRLTLPRAERNRRRRIDIQAR